MRFSRLVLAGSFVLVACGNDGIPAPTLAGTYTATTFQITQAGATSDVLAAGGSLTITISSSGATTGALNIPVSIGGGSTGSMAGTATLTNGSDVKLTQAADTFVRDLQWTLSQTALAVDHQLLAGATFTIVLMRQ